MWKIFVINLMNSLCCLLIEYQIGISFINKFEIFNIYFYAHSVLWENVVDIF